MPSFPFRLAAVAAAAALAGCAALPPDDATALARDAARRATGAEPALAPDPAARDAEVARLLAAPLGAGDAVRLAFVSSRALQAALASSVAVQQRALQSGRLANPHFAFERATRGDELEITRALSIGLVDLLSWPSRRSLAQARLEQERWRLAGEVLALAHETRSAWVRAVAAEQQLAWRRQALDAAEAAAELARRMHAAGNFSRLERAREQAFEAEARGQLARARVAAAAEREALVRRLGLSADEAARLKLPERLPELPAQPREPDAVAAAAADGRLDLKLAEARWRLAERGAGLATAGALDVALGASRTSETALPIRKGWELELGLPLFDTGSTARAAAGAEALAARNAFEQAQRDAASRLRERYAAVREAHALARQQRDELVPLAREVSEQMLLRYNGMLSSVFELLADARAQAAAVGAALDAERDFWLADAALDAELRGIAVDAPAFPSAARDAAPAAAGH